MKRLELGGRYANGNMQGSSQTAHVRETDRQRHALYACEEESDHAPIVSFLDTKLGSEPACTLKLQLLQKKGMLEHDRRGTAEKGNRPERPTSTFSYHLDSVTIFATEVNIDSASCVRWP